MKLFRRAPGRGHGGGAALAALLALLVPPAPAAPGAAGSAPAPVDGVRFSRLGICAASGCLVFVATDAASLPPDTLCLEPTTATLSWGGGAFRGLAAGDGDTVYTASRLGVHVFSGEGPPSLRAWRVPLAGEISGPPAEWPVLREGRAPAGGRAARGFGGVEPFPERYFRLRDGTVVFLIDAESPPRPGLLLYDLHTRLPSGIELKLARNLAARDWVLSPDSTRWALAAEAHVPDYGGQVIDVLVAGEGETSHRFSLGRARFGTWDGGGDLWILAAGGRLFRIVPRAGAWDVRRVDASDPACGCEPAAPESLWTWTLPRPFPSREEALARAAKLALEEPAAPSPWIIGDGAGGVRLCWGGFTSPESAGPGGPVAESLLARVPIEGARYVGTTARITSRELGGVAILRQSAWGDAVASELWWRFTAGERAVRLAGPWGL